MDLVKVPGKKKTHKVFLYALSTCAWCKMTKQFLKDNDVEFEFVDVDLASQRDHEKIRQEILNRGAEPNYPLIIVDDKVTINGFRKDKLKEALEI